MIIFILLVVWSIFGSLLFAKLEEEGNFLGSSNKTIFIMAVICGPLVLMVYLIGAIYGLLHALAIILIDKLDK